MLQEIQLGLGRTLVSVQLVQLGDPSIDLLGRQWHFGEGTVLGPRWLEVAELPEITDGVKVFRVVVVVVPHDALQRVGRQQAEGGRWRREPALGEVAADLKEEVIPRELLVQSGRVCNENTLNTLAADAYFGVLCI